MSAGQGLTLLCCRLVQCFQNLADPHCPDVFCLDNRDSIVSGMNPAPGIFIEDGNSRNLEENRQMQKIGIAGNHCATTFQKCGHLVQVLQVKGENSVAVNRSKIVDLFSLREGKEQNGPFSPPSIRPRMMSST